MVCKIDTAAHLSTLPQSLPLDSHTGEVTSKVDQLLNEYNIIENVSSTNMLPPPQDATQNETARRESPSRETKQDGTVKREST